MRLTERTKRAKQVRRENARHSSGPKTEAGRLRASRNALTHGLSIPFGLLPNAKPAIEKLATALLASLETPQSDVSTWYAACAFAEAQLDLERIRSLRHDALTQEIVSVKKAAKDEFKAVMAVAKMTGDFDAMFKEVDTLLRGRVVTQKPSIFERYKSVAPLLQRLDRYERRALSRRKNALRLLSN